MIRHYQTFVLLIICKFSMAELFLGEDGFSNDCVEKIISVKYHALRHYFMEKAFTDRYQTTQNCAFSLKRVATIVISRILVIVYIPFLPPFRY